MYLRLAHYLVAITLAVTGLSAQAQAKTAPDYPLGAGDTLHIQVFQNPDLTIDTRVSESGSITYPLIGAVDLGGLSVATAEKKIASALEKGGFIKQPQVTILLTLVRGNQVSVLGQVNHPGRFPLETTNTRISDMLANAGGTTPLGDDVAIVTGLRDGKAFRQQVDIPTLFTGGNPQNNVVLQGGDTIYVNLAPVFYIYGEAQHPGSYRINRGMTVMQALAQGGGPTTRGSETRLRLTRKSANGSVLETRPKLTDPVLPDDVIYVNESLF